MPRFGNRGSMLPLVFIALICSSAESAEDSFSVSARNEETRKVHRNIPIMSPSQYRLKGVEDESDGEPTVHSYQSKDMLEGFASSNLGNAIQKDLFQALPKTCSYEGQRYKCAIGAACFLQDMRPMDLCEGGLVWACCVPRPRKPDNNTLIQPECGKTYMHMQSRIIGGQDANFGQYPWQVALVLRGLFTKRIYCGGTLISERYVITAAHCVQKLLKLQLRARLGEHNIDGTSDLYPHDEYEIEEKFVHQGYNRTEGVNDIALLRLKIPVRFRGHIVPICLPQRGARYEGKMATVSGWGTLEEGVSAQPASLQSVNVQVINNDICREWLSAHSKTAELQETMMCAGFENGGKDSCQGDSGGPLILFNDGRAELIGIVSWGVRCGQPKAPGVYTRVSDYLDWIHEIIEN